MTNITDFIPLIRAHVSGCPDNIIQNAALNACIRFCTDTWIIRETLPASDITIGVDDYTINAAANKAPVGMISFLYDKRELDKKTEEELDIIDQGWRTADPGVATYVMAPEPDRILLNRVPAETIVGGMIVEIATRPIDDALEVDDLLYKDWRDTIKYGALAELLEIPEKQWSDMKQSIWYGKRFNFGIQSGKARARMGNMTKSTNARMRAWI